MRKIQLLATELLGFRSFRARTLIEFSEGGGLKYLSGENKQEPRLGANGAGKSTLWDAVAFCISGRSVKGIRASDLLSWGSKEIAVQTIWRIDGEIVSIERKGMPDRLTINEQPADQLAIDRLLGLSRARFLQSVIFGQATPLFIDLASPDRGALLDEVLDLGIWLKASEKASERHIILQKSMEAAARDIAFFQGKLEGMEDPESFDRAIASWDGEQAARIDAAIEAVEAAESELKKLAPKGGAPRKQSDAFDESEIQIEQLAQQIVIHMQAWNDRKIEGRVYQQDLLITKQRITFYQHSRVCDTCLQTIDESFVAGQLKLLESRSASLEAQIKGNLAHKESVENTLAKLEADRESLRKQQEAIRTERALAAEAHRRQQREIDFLAKAAEDLASQANPHEARRDALIAERAAAEAKVKEANAIKRRMQGQAIRMDFWKTAFKRVRLFMVKRILAQLEIETESAAIALGLIGWKIEFNTELETKSGSLKPGIHIFVHSPKASAIWEAWSGGEGQRIRLAVALGLSSLIQRMAGVAFGFEVYDEPTAFLSAEGIDDLMACLEHRADVTKKSIWLCDHRSLNYPGFSEIWSVRKTETGSDFHLVSDLER